MISLRKQLSLLASIMLAAMVLTGCQKTENTAEKAPETAAETAGVQESGSADAAMGAEIPFDAEHELHHVSLTVENYGTIELELDATIAPITVANFLKLAGEGFYDGLTFHRIIDGFMIQGGRPKAEVMPERIKGEFAANDVNNPISHVKGIISMARSQEFDSASSQFFITVGDALYLDGQYAAFGRVTEGLEVAEQIAKDAKPVDNNGTIPAMEQPVISSMVVLD